MINVTDLINKPSAIQQMKLKFKKADNDRWFCGNYKIVHYDYYSNGGACMEKSNYQAYIPDHFYKGQPVFGNRVDKNVKYYETFGDAVKACEKHAKQEAQHD